MAQCKDFECLMYSSQNAWRRHRPSLALEMDWDCETCDGTVQSGWWLSPTGDLTVKKKGEKKEFACMCQTHDPSTWLDIVCLNKLLPRHIIHGNLNSIGRNLSFLNSKSLFNFNSISKVQDNSLRQMSNLLRWRTHGWLSSSNHTLYRHC